MSTGYTYTDRSGRPMGIDTLSEEVWLAVPKGNLFIANEDAPAVATELLKAAGIEATILPKTTAEVQVDAGFKDSIFCGTSPHVIHGTSNEDPHDLRTIAANYIALAEYIESKAQREADAEKKLQERRNKIARDIGERYDGVPAGSYHTGTWRERVAIDRIIELEDGKAKK